MSNFEKITETPEALGAFLESLTVINSPWEDGFHKAFCGTCGKTDCGICPHQDKRNNPMWWLTMGDKTGEGKNRVVMWVKMDGYRKTMEEFAGKIKEARSERIKATGDNSFTHIEALLTELVEVLLPDEKCRVVMDYDPDTENIIFSRLPARDIQEGTKPSWKPLRFQNGRLQQG